MFAISSLCSHKCFFTFIPSFSCRAFLITDMNSKKLNITTSGATAVCALLASSFESNTTSRKLYVANVGDSRAVLVSSLLPGDAAKVPPETESSYFATRLSFDHRAEDEQEQQRIKEAGGFITRNRVLGILAVSRSFGDHGMKDFVIGTKIAHSSLLHYEKYP